jgi:hypothetical protein
MPATLADIQVKYGDHVYPLYKDQMHEPYMEEYSSIGYKGVVLYDEIEKKIQCQECGGWYTSLSNHVINGHGITAREYKKAHNLPIKVPLCSPEYSFIKRKEALKRSLSGRMGGKKGMKWSKETLEKRRVASKNGKNTVWFKNKFGLCEAQMTYRLSVVQKMSGCEKITTGDIIKYDYKLYSALKEKYGSVLNACDTLEIYSSRKKWKFLDCDLIAFLRLFVIKNKRIPTYKDLQDKRNCAPAQTSFSNHFGSWNRAKMTAGLDQLLEEINNDKNTTTA